MSKKVLVLLAEGFEEVEAITPIDYLRRAGIGVTTLAVGDDLTVKGSHNIPIIADRTISELTKQGPIDIASLDGVLLPGGIPGAPNLAASKEVGDLLKDMNHSGKWICAICASPAMVLFPLGILKDRHFTCYPGMETKVSGALWSEEQVVVDENLITSRAAGTAGLWAIRIIGKLIDEAAAQGIASGVLL